MDKYVNGFNKLYVLEDTRNNVFIKEVNNVINGVEDIPYILKSELNLKVKEKGTNSNYLELMKTIEKEEELEGKTLIYLKGVYTI